MRSWQSRPLPTRWGSNMGNPRYKPLTGDASGFPATFCAKTDDPEVFAVYEQQLWEDIDSTADEGKYNVRGGLVNIRGFELEQTIPGYFAPSVRRALRACGLEITSQGIASDYDGDVIASHGSKHFDLVIVECLFSYGAFDHAGDFSGNNLRDLVRDIRGAM